MLKRAFRKILLSTILLLGLTAPSFAEVVAGSVVNVLQVGGVSSLADAGTETVYSASFPLIKGEAYGWEIQFTSEGSVAVKVEVEQGFSRPDTEGAADTTNYALADNKLAELITITDEDLHNVSYAPNASPFIRLKLTGLSGNDATTTLSKVKMYAFPSAGPDRGEDISGNVGGFTDAIAWGSTNTGGAYTSGMDIGAKVSFTNAVRIAAGSGIINSVVVMDKAKQNAALDVIFFSTDPSNTTFTDNATLTIHDTDLLNIVGTVSILASDYVSFNDNSVATTRNVGLAFKLQAGTTLYAAVVCRGTPTYASTSDLKVLVKVFQD